MLVGFSDPKISQAYMAKGSFKYYVSKEVGGWGWPNADVFKKLGRITSFGQIDA